MVWFFALIFIISCLLLIFSGNFLIGYLSRIAKFLGWKEFVVAFLTISLGVSLPNFFVGILSALNKIPQLSLGDVIGGNIFTLTMMVAISAFVSRQGISAQSRTVQGSSLFTIGSAILPLLLILDGSLSQIDGVLLLAIFGIYISWLFKKEDRFKKVYDGMPEIKNRKEFLKDMSIVIISIIFLILGAQGVVQSSLFFAQMLNLPLIFIGIFIVGIANSLPETFFSIRAARKGQDWMILGNLMGSVMITSTLVLGIVAIIHPIEIKIEFFDFSTLTKIEFFDFSVLTIGRIFLIISAIFFLLFLRTDKKITKKEGLFLLSIYILFVLILFVLFEISTK